MFLEALVVLALAQDPGPPQVTAAPTGQDAAAEAAAPEAPRQSRRERQAALVCENRAPTGSVMSRRICRTQQRSDADVYNARAYVQDATRGTSNEPMSLGGPGPAPN
jgi:hypothetical protein